MSPVLEFAGLLADGISYLAFLLPEDDYLDYCPVYSTHP